MSPTGWSRRRPEANGSSGSPVGRLNPCASARVCPARPDREAFPGRAPTGSGETSGSCSTTVRRATTAWCGRPCLARAPVPAGDIHPMPTEGLTPQDAALSYEQELKTVYGVATLSPARPLFDVTFLGLGPRRAYRLAVPGTAILKRALALGGAVIGAKAEPRITLTYPLRKQPRYRLSRDWRGQVSGAGAICSSGDPVCPPRTSICTGHLHIFADRAAAPREGAMTTRSRSRAPKLAAGGDAGARLAVTGHTPWQST